MSIIAHDFTWMFLEIDVACKMKKDDDLYEVSEVNDDYEKDNIIEKYGYWNNDEDE